MTRLDNLEQQLEISIHTSPKGGDLIRPIDLPAFS